MHKVYMTTDCRAGDLSLVHVCESGRYHRLDKLCFIDVDKASVERPFPARKMLLYLSELSARKHEPLRLEHTEELCKGTSKVLPEVHAIEM